MSEQPVLATMIQNLRSEGGGVARRIEVAQGTMEEMMELLSTIGAQQQTEFSVVKRQ